MGIAKLFNQAVTLETYLGTGIHGPTYAAPVTVVCFVNDSSKLIRDSNGEQVVSMTTIYAPLSTAPDDPPTAGQFAPQSKVTVAGRKTHVIAAERNDSAGPAGVWHTRIQLA